MTEAVVQLRPASRRGQDIARVDPDAPIGTGTTGPGPGLGPAREWECMAREQLAKGLEVAGRRYEGPTRTLRVTVAPDAHTLTQHFCTAS